MSRRHSIHAPEVAALYHVGDVHASAAPSVGFGEDAPVENRQLALDNLRKSREFRRSSEPSLRRSSEPRLSSGPRLGTAGSKEAPRPAGSKEAPRLGSPQKRPSEARGSKEGTVRARQSQSTPSLPRIGQPAPLERQTSGQPAPLERQTSSPTAPRNHVLDSVLGRLDKPKLQEALDRMSKDIDKVLRERSQELGAGKKALRRAVKELDINGDGLLSKTQMATGLRKMGVSLLPSEMDAIMRAFDIEQNGTVELNVVIEVTALYLSQLKLDQTADTGKFEAQAQKQQKLVK